MSIDKITSAAITDGTITSSDLASGAVQNQSAFKNIVINGDMQQAQRANSATGKTSSGIYTVDRFGAGISSAGTWTQSQSTTVPSGQGFARSLKMDCTTAQGSLGSSDRLQISQKFEGQMLQYLKKGTSSAESLTLSFWVRSNKTGTYICELYDTDNTRHIAKSYTISSADTWEKKTITYAGDTSGAFGNDANESLAVYFWLVAGSDFTSGTLATSWASISNSNRAAGQTVNLSDSTDNEWYVTGIQLEVGTSASDFEFTPFDISRDRCKRYFYKTTGNQWLFPLSTNNNNARSQVVFRPSMRATPTSTVSFSNTGTGSGTQFENVNHVTVYVNGLSSSGDTALQSGATFDAEL